MGKMLCEKNLRDVWCRNEIVRAEIGQIVHTHTHTRVSYSSIEGQTLQSVWLISYKSGTFQLDVLVYSDNQNNSIVVF